MPVRLDKDNDRPQVAHLHLDFGPLNLLTPNAIDDLVAALADVSDQTAVLTVNGTPTIPMTSVD